MPRLARVVAVGVPHHVTQRGNNRQQVFFSDQQRRLYLATLAGYATRNQLQILGYCLMPNHIHAVVVPQLQTSMGHSFGRAHSAYSRYFNRTRNRSGHLWQNRFYSAPLDRPHLLAALRYVDLNPVRARMTDHAESYCWSSATAHLTGRDPFGLIDPAAWEELCPAGGWKDMLQPARGSDEEWAQRLRAATHSGKPLGSQGFIEQMERLTGHSLEIRGPGRPRQALVRRAAGGLN